MCWMMSHPEEAKAIGAKLMERTVNSFSIQHLNDLFYATMLDIQKGVYDENKVDMAKCNF